MEWLGWKVILVVLVVVIAIAVLVVSLPSSGSCITISTVPILTNVPKATSLRVVPRQSRPSDCPKPLQARRAICLVTDQFERGQRTVRDIRQAGAWTGDVILVSTEEAFAAKARVPPAGYTHLFLYPMIRLADTTPSRKGRALFQQFKLYMFHPDLRAHWDVILYLDAGTVVRAPLAPIFEREHWVERVVANSDARDLYIWDLNGQFEHRPGDPVIPHGTEDYFQTGFMLYDVQRFCTHKTLTGLKALFLQYPNHYNNEQSIMNLWFYDVWEPLVLEPVDSDGYRASFSVEIGLDEKGEAEGYASSHYPDRTQVQMMGHLATMFQGMQLSVMDSQQGAFGQVMAALVKTLGAAATNKAAVAPAPADK